MKSTPILRRSATRLAVLAAALGLFLALSASPAAAAPKAVEGGELDWGVSTSFRGYIEGSPPAGTIELSGGAAKSVSGTYYRFPVVSGSYDEATDTNEVQYAGTIEYKKYGGVLDIKLSDPKVVLEGDEGAIFAHAVSGSTDYGVIELVELDATGVVPVGAGETLSWEGIKSALTAEGAPVFGGSYPAGTAFDDVAFTDSWVPTPPVAPTAVQGGDLDWGVKASWRGYIKGAGAITVADGAKEDIDGTYVFPVVSGTYYPADETNEVQYAGSVNFSAHEGALDVTLENPKLVLEGDEGILFVHAVSGTTDYGVIELVELDATGVSPVAGRQTLAWSGIKSALTAAGVPVFGNYPAGTAFDTLAVTDSWVPTPPPVEPGGGEETVTPPADTGTAAETEKAPDQTATTPVVNTPAKLAVGKGALKVSGGGAVKVATLSCPVGGGTCQAVAPKRVGAKIDGKSYALTVSVPKVISAGKSAPIKLHLSKAARAALGSEQVVVKFKVSLKANGTTVKHLIKVKIAGKK